MRHGTPYSTQIASVLLVPKLNSLDGRSPYQALQSALDEQDLIGRWQCDVIGGRVVVDGFIAQLFNVDPGDTESGVSAEAYVAAIHPDDRERVRSVARRSASEGAPFLTEYRVISGDGAGRWVLARGRFFNDDAGRLMRGSGILVDITRVRKDEDALDETEAFLDEAPLDRAAEHAINTQEAIFELQDPELKACADALLMALGRKLAQRQVQDRRRRMN